MSATPTGLVIHERRMRMAMKVGGEYNLAPPRNTWPQAAAELGLRPDAVIARVRDLAEAAPAAFAAAADEVVALNSLVVRRLVDGVADRAARCAAVLQAPTCDGPCTNGAHSGRWEYGQRTR